ncbi:MAG: amidohydrolase [Clostridia bacterium]|nr:amidohydrolase [Clostridia bacterium]
MKIDFYQKAKEYEEEIQNMYTYLHENPELSGAERETQTWIMGLLEKWKVEHRPCADTGIYAAIKTARPGHTIMLRADMDGLPVQEQTGLSYASKKEGIMHACGHDAHMSVLLGCIRILKEYEDMLCGNIIFMFQPSEERNGGSKRMIEEGVLEEPKPELAAAFHVWPQKAHSIACIPGPVMAQPDGFRIDIEGKGGHGASPHLCKNPISVLAPLALAIKEITSDKISAQESAVVNVCQIHCGENYNLVADHGYLEGTIRTYDTQVREQIIHHLEILTESMPQAYDMKGFFTLNSGYPPTINDKKTTVWAYHALQDNMKNMDILSEGEPAMLGEDFSCFREVCPTLFMRLGCWPKEAERQHPLHHNCFCIDRSILTDGAAAFCMLTAKFSKEGYQTDEND